MVPPINRFLKWPLTMDSHSLWMFMVDIARTSGGAPTNIGLGDAGDAPAAISGITVSWRKLRDIDTSWWMGQRNPNHQLIANGGINIP